MAKIELNKDDFMKIANAKCGDLFDPYPNKGGWNGQIEYGFTNHDGSYCNYQIPPVKTGYGFKGEIKCIEKMAERLRSDLQLIDTLIKGLKDESTNQG